MTTKKLNESIKAIANTARKEGKEELFEELLDALWDVLPERLTLSLVRSKDYASGYNDCLAEIKAKLEGKSKSQLLRIGNLTPWNTYWEKKSGSMNFVSILKPNKKGG